MYHVSTMMPKEGNTALQHIGNDEVHVVWMESSAPYDPNLITKQVSPVVARFSFLIRSLPRYRLSCGL